MKIWHKSYLGARIADAVAMPAHWYYDTNSLDRDYPDLDFYRAPRGEHPDSILWRSNYKPINMDADILHYQQQYWGRKGVHYHQFLEAGENTMNFKLADELYRFVLLAGGYSADDWLNHYVECMRTPGWHGDTYIEEAHRGFFENRARGIRLNKCGIADLHIGGLAQVPALVAALHDTGKFELSRVSEHVALTHNHPYTLAASETFARLLCHLADDVPLLEAIELDAPEWLGKRAVEKLAQLPDRVIVGRIYSSACYLPESFTASLALAWKYHDRFESGILGNALCGGDNCHRGAVVGALLGAVNTIPEKWSNGLKVSSDKRLE